MEASSEQIARVLRGAAKNLRDPSRVVTHADLLYELPEGDGADVPAPTLADLLALNKQGCRACAVGHIDFEAAQAISASELDETHDLELDHEELCSEAVRFAALEGGSDDDIGIAFLTWTLRDEGAGTVAALFDRTAEKLERGEVPA